MWKYEASYSSRITGSYSIKVVESDDVVAKESEGGPLGDSVPRLPSDGDNEESKEPEEEWKPEEEPEEWPVQEPQEELKEWTVENSEEEPEEWPAEKAEEEPEESPSEEAEKEWQPEEPEEWPVEEAEEEAEEWPSEEPEKELENELEEETNECSVEKLEEEPAEEPSNFGFKTLSDYNDDDEIEQQIKDPDEDSLEEFVSKPSSEIDTNEAVPQPKSVPNNSNEKKRSLAATPEESAMLPVYQSQKKHRQEQSSEPKSDVGTVVANLQSESGVSKFVNNENASEQPERSGSSGKRSRAKWDVQTEDEVVDEFDTTGKRRKTVQIVDDSQLKMLGPIQLPDFKKGFVSGSDQDLEILELKAKLTVINCKLHRSELHDDRPKKERSPSPEPVYNNLGIRINTRESRLRLKLIQERQCIISSLIQKNPTFEPPSDDKPLKLFKKLYIPVKEYPWYNFVGPIIGPRGNTQKRMQKETGAKIQVRGKGASRSQQEPDNSDIEDLHVYIEADNQKSVDAAVAMVEKLLIPFNEGVNEPKLAQLKELAQLNGTDRSKNLCRECSEEGREHYICSCLPSASSTTISCDTCGNSHPTACGPLKTLSQASNCLPGSSGLGLGSTPIAQNKPNKEISDASLYVCHLPQAVDDNWLKELFSPFGKITSVRVIKDRITGFSKGYGFVNFENFNDAAAAVMHMHGYKMCGKMLVVRVAGRPPVAGASIPSLLPNYPLPAAAFPDVPNQTSWLYPPGSMLPAPRAHFPNAGGTCLCSSYIYLGDGEILNSEAVGYPVSDVSSLGNSNGASSLHSSYAFSNQIPFTSPTPLTQIPGYSDCPGFQHWSYFATPTFEPSPGLHYGQSLESEPKLILCPSTDLRHQESSLHLSQSSESDPKPVSCPTAYLQESPLPLIQSSKSKLKAIPCPTIDHLQQELPLQLNQSPESEQKSISSPPAYLLPQDA